MIIAVYQPSLDDCLKFLHDAEITDNEFVQFLTDDTDAFRGFWVVLRVVPVRVTLLREMEVVPALAIKTGQGRKR